MDNLSYPDVTLPPRLLKSLRCSTCENRFEMKCAWCGRSYCREHIWVDDFYPRAVCVDCRPKNYKGPSLVILVDQENPYIFGSEDRIIAVIFNSGRRLCLAGSCQEEPDYLATERGGRILVHWSWVVGEFNGPPHYIARDKWPIADVKMLMTLDNWRILKDISLNEIMMNYRHLLKDSWKYQLPKHMLAKE
jgi:hypothetical protein